MFQTTNQSLYIAHKVAGQHPLVSWVESTFFDGEFIVPHIPTIVCPHTHCYSFFFHSAGYTTSIDYIYIHNAWIDLLTVGFE